MADISKITLPNNNQYDIKDNVARGQIENLQSELENKVDKITGKSLSTNDYTTAEKNKLASIESEANKTIIDSTLSSTSENPLQNKIINTALSEKLGTSGDSKNNIITFTTDDTTDSAVTRTTGWSTVAALASGITHANLFNRISTMMKNVRWLYKMLGDTDISALSTEHTITGALSKLNTDLTWNTVSQASSLSSLTAYLDELVVSGTRSGYLNSSASTAVGLSNDGTSNYWQYLSHSTGMSIVIFYKSTGDRISLLKKLNGTWDNAFIHLPTRAEVNKLNTDLNDLKLKRKVVTATTAANGSINISTLTGIYTYNAPVLQIIPRDPNANIYAIVTVAGEGTVYVTIRKTTDNSLVANTEVNLLMFYAIVVTNADV